MGFMNDLYRLTMLARRPIVESCHCCSYMKAKPSSSYASIFWEFSLRLLSFYEMMFLLTQSRTALALL